jgi:hypothetical protein
VPDFRVCDVNRNCRLESENERRIEEKVGTSDGDFLEGLKILFEKKIKIEKTLKFKFFVRTKFVKNLK